MENKLKVWLARDKNGSVFIYEDKPWKDTNHGEWIPNNNGVLDKEFYTVMWEDDKPTEAYITLAELQEQSQTKEIDWEQQRYEIAKDILIKTYFEKKTTPLYDIDINLAISYANKIIDKLKEQNK